jgi:hypothetical protein
MERFVQTFLTRTMDENYDKVNIAVVAKNKTEVMVVQHVKVGWSILINLTNN